jgi:chemotaxis protein methyltransferase CheR
MLSELGAQLGKFNISIWGTDIDNASLVQARKGEYDKEMVESVPAYLLNKYFDYQRNPDNTAMTKTQGVEHDGTYKVKQEIRNIVRFRRHDLVSDKPMKCFDIIICRNVLIYFNRKFQSRLFNAFYNGLNRDGYLVLGKSEMLSKDMLPKIECVSKRNCVYRKIIPDGEPPDK